MEIIKCNLPGLLELVPSVYQDSRGFFLESWNKDVFASIGVGGEFVQDNHAKSGKDVLRGLHFQTGASAQGKLVWVVSGAVLDIVVDVRRGSPTYGQWHAVELSAENFKRFYVPRGFAHGYLTLRDDTEFMYKVDNYYDPSSEGGIRWNDPELNLPWGIDDPILSPKDELLPLLSEFDSPFEFEE